jgi:hypothetical protein
MTAKVQNMVKDGAVAYKYKVDVPVLSIPDPVRNSILECVRKADWDGEGADQITRNTCNTAIDFVGSVLERAPETPTPKVSPSVLGSVTLYWRNGDNHLIVRVHGDSPSVFYQSEAQGNVRYHGDEPTYEVVQKVLRLFGSPNAA